MLDMLHRKYPRVPLADLEDAYSRTVSDLFTNPGRLADVAPDFTDGSEFMRLLVNAASMDVLDLLRSQDRRGEAAVGDFEQDRRRGDVNASEIDWKDGSATAAGTAAQQFLDNRLDATSDTDTARAEGTEAHRLLEYLAAIPEADRTIAAMVLEGMKPRHIAAEVGLTAKQVSQSWERAQGRLRTMLAKGLDETRLCGLVNADLMRMREDGTITPALRQHIRSCEGCAFMVREQVGSKAAAIIGLPLPLLGAGGGAAWWMLGRHARRAASQVRHLLGSAGSSAGGQATTVAAKVAVAAVVTVPTATVAVVATHALTHHHAKPPVHHVVVTTPTKPAPPVVTTPVVTTPTVTTPAKPKPKPRVTHKAVHRKRRRVLRHTPTTTTTTPATTTTTAYTPPPPATVTTTATATPPPATHTTATTTAPKTVTHASQSSSGSSLSGGGLPTPSQSSAAP